MTKLMKLSWKNRIDNLVLKNLDNKIDVDLLCDFLEVSSSIPESFESAAFRSPLQNVHGLKCRLIFPNMQIFPPIFQPPLLQNYRLGNQDISGP